MSNKEKAEILRANIRTVLEEFLARHNSRHLEAVCQGDYNEAARQYNAVCAYRQAITIVELADTVPYLPDEEILMKK